MAVQRAYVKRSHPSRRLRWAAGILAALLLGGVGADRVLKSKRHPGLLTFMGQLARNYPKGMAVEPETLELRIEEQDLEQLERVVEQARKRGVILPEGNSYVPAEITGPQGAFKAKVRIKGKLTDHVEGRKWSLRVIAKKDGGFRGMRRFSLQHPGTRNYLCDWLYHRLMAAEGVVALNYGFVRVLFNGDDLGIYAYEEHFGPELLEHNGRAKGPLFRFDPALFWEHRLNEMSKARYDEPFAAYQAAALDAFGSSDLEKDKPFRSQFQEAVGLIEAFRRGRLTASQVFDADRLARHHAILDLLGGHHSMDFSDVKFYYDPVLRRVEPVSYESFSGRPIRELAGSNKWVGRHDPAMDLHTQWFNDEQVFRNYVRHLERVSRKDWLDSSFAAVGPALDSASATLYREFPYKELDRSVYYQNQRIIRKLLDPPKAFHAYLRDNGPDTVRITVVPIEALPMEVHGLVLPDGAKAPPVGQAIIPVRKPGRPGEPLELRFAVGQKVDRGSLKLQCSVLGASVRREVEVFPLALLDADEAIALAPSPSDPRSMPWLAFNDTARTITIKPGIALVDRDVELPSGYTVRGVAPLRLRIAKGVRFISHAPMELSGLPEAPVEVENDGTLILTGAQPPSQWKGVRATGAGQYVVQEAAWRLNDVTLRGGAEAPVITAVRARLQLDRVMITGGRDGLRSVASEVTASGTSVLGAKDDGLTMQGGQLSWSEGAMEGGKGPALKAGLHARCRLEKTGLRSGANGIELRQGAELELKGGFVEAMEGGIVVKDMERITGPSRLLVSGARIEAQGEAVQPGKGNNVKMDGKALGPATRAKGEAQAGR